MDNVQASMEMSYWLRKRIDQYGSATMPQFAEKFKLSNRQDADLLFSHLISKSSLRKTTRHTLRSDYDIWKRNEGDQFWAALEATTQIASDIVVGSVPKARKLVLGDNHPSLSKPSTLANECSPTTSRKRDRESFEGSPPASILVNYEYLFQSSDSVHRDDSLDLGETDALVAMINSVKHRDCSLWVLDGCCVACMTDKYKELSIQALRAKELKKSEPADVMILAGTFAPWHPTTMMGKIFSKKCLQKIRDSLSTNMEPIENLDADISILHSIRHRADNDIEKAVVALNGVTDMKLRRLFQQMKEELPAREQRELSEETLVANHVSPILRAFTHDPVLEIFSHFPNTNSQSQTRQGVKPDRPDFKVVIGKKEVAFGEVTGPSQKNDQKKNGWDLYRLSRFGTAVLNQGGEVVPLVQVIADSGTIYRHIVKVRGVMVLAEVGAFSVPMTTVQVGGLLASEPVAIERE